jgi:hypothetical protein
MKRLAAIEKRQKLRRTEKLVLVDCVALFGEAHWSEFESGDAATRRRLRREFRERSDALYASHNVANSVNGEVVAIVVSLALPADDELLASD